MKSSQLSPGVTVSIDKKIYRVESSVKVSMAKGVPFIKTKLKDLMSDETIEKNFKPDQEIEEVKLKERRLEYLYLDGPYHEFLDIDNLELVHVPQEVISDKVNFLKEGIQVKAHFYGETIFSVELPQFLEIMIVDTEEADAKAAMSSANKLAILETGAKIEVPMFITSGDVVKVDTLTKEYVQRV